MVTFTLCQPVIFFYGNGVLGEMDFWGTSVCLVVFATVEVILFAWVFGMEKAWTELHAGSDIQIPRIYRFIIKYVTPLFLLIILGVWAWQEWPNALMLKGVSPENKPFVLITRLGLMSFFGLLVMLVRIVWKRRPEQEEAK